MEESFPEDSLQNDAASSNNPINNDKLAAAITRCDLMWSAADNILDGERFTPVQSCEIHPFVIVRNSQGQMHDDDDLESRDPSMRMHYRWRRGPARAVCFFHPHKAANVQCTITLRCFCGYPCFARGHKQLRRFYMSGGKCTLPRQPNEFSYGVPCRKMSVADLATIRDSDETHHRLLRQAGLVVDPDHEQWTVVSFHRNYSPRKDDVGHQLRFECVLTFEERSSDTPIVRVVTSAGGDTLRTDKVESVVGPRSSPVDLLRKSQVAVDQAAEERFWAAWEAAPTADSSVYRSVLTSCVIPQCPLVDPRPLVPVGILALFSGSPPSAATPQRVIPPNSPLARALGIGLVSPGKRRRPRLPPTSNGMRTDEATSRISARYAIHNSSQAATIAERREALLTDNAFANWGKASLSATKPLESKAKSPAVNGTAARDDGFISSGFTADAHRLRAASSKLGNEPSSGEQFTVMTWNVLADIYATSEAYPYCDPFVLAWNYRKERLLAEMLSYSPDVICLQEVQADHFEDFFAPALLKRGYEGLYKHKTTRVFRGSGKHRGGKYVCDGCATFFKVPKFRLVDHFGIEFARVAPPTGRASESKSDNKRLNKDNVALVLSLEQQILNGVRPGVSKPPVSRTSSQSVDHMAEASTATRRLVVANTHILANPEAPDVKIWQANTLTSVLTEYMEKSLSYARREGNLCLPGLVICGDFNSTPDSAVYQLVTAGTCDCQHEELQSSEVYKWLDDIRLGHGLNLRSSYGAANYMRLEAEKALSSTSTGGAPPPNPPSSYLHSHGAYEPAFTNYTSTYVGCLDYIFFDDRCLKLTGTLELLREIQLLEEAYALQLTDWALPSPQRPSDHSPLLSRFEWLR